MGLNSSSMKRQNLNATLESLNGEKFQPLDANYTQHVLGGTPTAGGDGKLNGKPITFASDCTEMLETGVYYAEFYDSDGKVIGAYTSPS